MNLGPVVTLLVHPLDGIRTRTVLITEDRTIDVRTYDTLVSLSREIGELAKRMREEQPAYKLVVQHVKKRKP